MAGVISLVMFIGSLLFKIIFKLRLGVPALYVGLMCTVWQNWYTKYEALGNIIFFALVACVVVSWIVTLTRFVRERYA